LAAILALNSCQSDSGITGTGNDSTIVLLNSEFRHGIDENIWELSPCWDCEAVVTEDRMLMLVAPGVPSGYGAYAGIVSIPDWTIDENETYLLTIEYEYGPYLCFDCGHFFGFRTGDTNNERLGLEIIGHDYGIEVLLRSSTPSCLVVLTTLGHEIIESMHTISIELSANAAVFRFDGQELARIPGDIACEPAITDINILLFISSSMHDNSIKYRLIRLEKFGTG
jgi:hypothetical protein